MINRIETAVEIASEDVSSGQKHLQSAAASKKKDRNALDLGDLLGRSKDGFQPLNTDDDAEVLSSDSEDDFNVPSLQT